MIRKTITYSGFALAILMVIVVFVTSKSYTQLGTAVLVYPIFAYFGYKLFMGDSKKEPAITIQVPGPKDGNANVNMVEANAVPANNEVTQVSKDFVGIADIEKRAFLKMIGGIGLSFVLYSLINRKVEGLFFGGNSFGSNSGSGTTDMKYRATDGYIISEIDNDGPLSYYGFINKDGAWYIMLENVSDGSFRYTRGDLNFSLGWSQRKTLDYDYYYKIFRDN